MTQDPLTGRQLANFRVEGVLGHGGMATVYYGQDIKLNRPVAIKVIDARFREKKAYVERFVQEARALARWRHENIVQIYYADDENGLYYFVMEFIDGQNLAKILEEYVANGELIPVEDVIRIGAAIASALDYAHQDKVIHRDVKPSNIFVERGGRVVLGDFGLALDMELGSVGETFGTAHYIAPEQARRSSDAVPESDLYSMGIILYEMLTGVIPFDDPSPTSVALQHLTLPPPPPRQINPNLNAETEAVLLKALSKTPADRYHSGAELMEALITALQAKPEPSAARPELPLTSPDIPSPSAPHTRHISQISVADRVRMALDSPPLVPQPLVEPTQRVAYSPSSPPLPAGENQTVSPQGAAVPTAQPVESTQLAPAPTSTPPDRFPSKPDPEKIKTAQPNRRLWVIGSLAGCLVTLAVISIIIIFIIGRLPLGKGSATVPAKTLPLTAIPTLPNSTTAMAVQLSPTSVSPETASSPAVDATPPAIKYPNGRRFMLYYDSNSFYILQVTGDKMSISSVAFERLDTMGVPTNSFSGQRWAEFYPTIKVGTCMRIEILGSPSYLNPPQCNNQYYSTRTPVRDDPTIFWTPMKGSTQFHVLWQDEEIARCEIAAQVCEVFFP